MFQSFPKMSRLSKPAIVSEKIDGTNAQIYIAEAFDPAVERFVLAKNNTLFMFAGSRNRFITPNEDNHGFADWVQTNAEELFKLGFGRHFGEWWGSGINRNYGLKEKRFSLFNTGRWRDGDAETPRCCNVVPVLGACGLDQVDTFLEFLKVNGSVAVPGFMNPEGIVIYHEGRYYKKTFENDKGKWSVAA